MLVNGKNECISCTVDTCEHHARNEAYCTLDKITVGSHETNSTRTECADCESFENRAK